jgi:serine/threonine protein kinase
MRQVCRPPTDRHELLSVLAESDLLTAAQFAKADAAAPDPASTARDTAQLLVSAGLLTPFQAERLLSGRTDGLVLGQHVIQDQVGKGSVGRVYRATHRAMNRTVAIKVISADVTKSSAARQTFHREVRAAARLNHPHIVTAFDANEVGDRFYLVMEFVDGPTLETLVRERGPLPWPEACEVIRQVAVGLQHAHDQGMVHRDIKPANLLVSRVSPSMPGCVVKIADFGIAKLSPALADAPPAIGLTGTPDYVAPEQAYNAQSADHRADLYSLGCVFYFLLTGQPPFAGGDTAEKVRRHQCESAPSIERLRPDLPPTVAEVVTRLLAKDPKQRIATASALAEVLGGLAADRGGGIDFNLPAAQPGQYSFASGYLTGLHASPHSGRHAAYSTPSSMVAAETSPWSQLTDEIVSGSATADQAAEETPFALTPLRERRSRAGGLSSITILVLCGTLVISIVMGVVFLTPFAGK